MVQYELKALSKTICEYSTDNYITSYAEQLLQINIPEDKEKLIVLVNRLLNWYTNEIIDIEKNDYVHSKDSHLKSFKLLKQLKELLKMN